MSQNPYESLYVFNENSMKDEIRKELEELKRQRDALLKKNPELKALDIRSFLRDRERRIRKAYNRRRKAI